MIGGFLFVGALVTMQSSIRINGAILTSALLLRALSGLPSFVVYSCFSAGTILLVTILGALVFKEKPGRKAWTGLGMIVLALVIMNIN